MKHPCTIPKVQIDFHHMARGILALLTADEREEVAALERWPKRIEAGTRDLMRERIRVLTLKHHDVPEGLIEMPRVTEGLIDPELLEQATDNLMKAVLLCLAIEAGEEIGKQKAEIGNPSSPFQLSAFRVSDFPLSRP